MQFSRVRLWRRFRTRGKARNGSSGQQLSLLRLQVELLEDRIVPSLSVLNINSIPLSSSPNTFTVVGNTVYFEANGGPDLSPYLNGLWKSDGTAAGTQFVSNTGIGQAPANVNGTLFFPSGDSMGGIEELWKSDGTSAGTQLVKDIWPGGRSSYPNNLRHRMLANVEASNRRSEAQLRSPRRKASATLTGWVIMHLTSSV